MTGLERLYDVATPYAIRRILTNYLKRRGMLGWARQRGL